MLRRLEEIKSLSGNDQWRSDELGTFSPSPSVFGRVIDREAFMQWLREKNLLHLLTLPSSRLKSIINEAYDPDLAALLTVEQRATLTPGEPASGMAPPGVEVYAKVAVRRTTARANKGRADADDDQPF